MTDQGPEPGSAVAVTDALALFGLVKPLVMNELPAPLSSEFFGMLNRFGDPRDRAAETNRRAERLLPVHDGLLAAYHHRDRIEHIEREVVARLRSAETAMVGTGATASVRMPVVGHEYVAFLLACRRTLDYLARGVGVCFDRDTYRIRRLSKALHDAHPRDLAEKAIELSADVTKLFPDLLTASTGHSERDLVAHFWPLEPAYLLVVFFRDGRIGIELQDGGRGHLPTATTLDPARMMRDEPLLSASLDRRLERLVRFCYDLVEFAVEAEVRRIAAS